ncbi:MAG: helix-turn-helix domain-containing protein [Chitinophagaceae bacterium]|nr:helix-turn-helix domain-containing protein [Chitinophagaceae bacterium]
MMNKKTARKYTSPVINQLLGEITPVEKLQTNTKMTLAARLDDLITARGWGKSEFAEKVNKNPSEITKWLSGTQNFTIDTLAEIGVALNMPVSELFAPKRVHVINRVQVVITVKEVQQSIRYVTPFSEVVSGFSNIYLGSHHDVMLSLTSRLQA